MHAYSRNGSVKFDWFTIDETQLTASAATHVAAVPTSASADV
jgi:hypothetical protein